jgi:hypothetical protein
MTREKLTEAADSLRQAAESAQSDEASERLQNQSEKFDSLADADRGPDHGRLAHHEHILTEIADENPAAAEYVEAALESIRAYRETVEGV